MSYVRFFDTNFRDSRKTDMSKFDYEKYKDILDYIDSYALGLELVDKDYQYDLYRDHYHDDIYHANINCWSKEHVGKKNTGFMITFYQFSEDIYCRIKLYIRVDVTEFSSHKIGARLRGKVEKWKKEKERNFHNYTIHFKNVQELEDICSVFSVYLP